MLTILITTLLVLLISLLRPAVESNTEIVIQVEKVIPERNNKKKVTQKINNNKVGTVVMCNGTEMFGRNESLIIPSENKKLVSWSFNDDFSNFSLGPKPLSDSKCLRGKKILFVGDSILRYTFLSLLNIVENGYFTLNNSVNPQANQYLKSFPTADPGEESKTVIETPVENEHPLWQKTYPNSPRPSQSFE